MLGKLFKYEFKATARIFLPLYVVLIFFAGISRLFIMVQDELNKGFGIPAVLSMMVYFAIIVATFALTIIVMVQRFYKSLLGDEGYLMFTLPVEPGKHIITKLLTSVAWVLISIIVTIISVFILAANAEVLKGIPEAWHTLVTTLPQLFGNLTALVVTEGILLIIVGIITGILMIYASIAIGHTFSRHKLIASFGSLIVLYMIVQTINAIIVWIVSLVNPQCVTMVARDIVPLIMTFVLIMNILYSTAYFTITNYIINKRLNLE